MVERVLEVGFPSLWELYEGTWRYGSLAGEPEGYVGRSLETGISFHRGSVWGTSRRNLLSRNLRAG